jgi:3-hydroxybutyryl-CoA dehydrogenase
MSLPEVVGVYGGGRMGAGIAHAFVAAGSSVVILEVNDEAAAAARDRVAATLEKAVARGSVAEATDTMLARLSVTSDATRLSSAGLVIEAVPEDPTLKKTVLGTIAHKAPAAFWASNTSSLSIGELAEDLPDPTRFIGLHFFNPVPASDLVEIVVGPKTSPDLVTRSHDWVADLGKSAITVTDTPGFASSRLGVGLALEAMRMLEEGVADAADIDTAMTLGYRHPMGPLRTTDIVGLDVRLAIAEHLERELGPRFAPPGILRDMVARGELGRKSGHGFYRW